MMGPFLQRLTRNQAGAAVIELAISAPVLALLVMGVTDVSSAFSRKLALEQGAQRAVEKVMQTTELKEVQDTIADEVALQAGVQASQVRVSFPRYCNSRLMTDTAIDEEGFSTGPDCAGGEKESHYILVTVTDSYEPLFPFLGMGTKQADGTYLVKAEAGMRTQ